jgi:hypothetical protein
MTSGAPLPGRGFLLVSFAVLAMVFHASQNTFGGEYLGPMFTGPAAVPLAWWRSAAWILAAAATLAVRRARSPAPRSARTPP